MAIKIASQERSPADHAPRWKRGRCPESRRQLLGSVSRYYHRESRQYTKTLFASFTATISADMQDNASSPYGRMAECAYVGGSKSVGEFGSLQTYGGFSVNIRPSPSSLRGRSWSRNRAFGSDELPCAPAVSSVEPAICNLGWANRLSAADAPLQSGRP